MYLSKLVMALPAIMSQQALVCKDNKRLSDIEQIKGDPFEHSAYLFDSVEDDDKHSLSDFKGGDLAQLHLIVT